MNCNISNKNSFKECVYNTFCQCYNQCVNLSQDFKKSQQVCSEIVYDRKTPSNFLHTIIKQAILFFIESELIVKVFDKFYIKADINLKFTWENVKSLKSEESKEMFWLFRKLIVDSMLKIILEQVLKLETVKIFSVGSTKISSDYDITLYGNSETKIYIIQNFNKIFKEYFKDDSSIVFDTNIYGQAYIQFENEEFFEKANCFQDFYYLKDSPSNDSCVSWSIIRFFKDLRNSFDENIFNQIYFFMSSKLKNLEIFETSFKIFLYLQNKDTYTVNYLNLLGIKEEFLENYVDKLIGIYDYISLVNYYGVETYITRGAFIDTVVNSQMCKKVTAPLKNVDYICSIIENVSFFFTHNTKTKYLVRVRETLKLLIEDTHYKSLSTYLVSIEKVLKPLEIISPGVLDYDKKYCSDIIESDKIDILQCPKYKIFNLLINLVYSLLKLYSVKKDSNGQIVFYNTFVLKKNNIFNKYAIKSITKLVV